jgi:SAM-dependent methyltransferase
MTTDGDIDSYTIQVQAELEHYADQEIVHDLPEIYHIWSERYVIPLLAEVGFHGLDDFLDSHVAEQCMRQAPGRARLVSLGAGNGDTEIAIARRLAERGIENLDVVLLELNPQMLQRAEREAARCGMGDRVTGEATDLNSWHAHESADIYFANHSLHHIVALENLLAEVSSTLNPDGVLLVNDMIGRNGHMRWPEAAELVQMIWHIIPPRYRWNMWRQAPDETYPDIDCSSEGFEGIRSQDILPLLLKSFHPEIYVTFANVVDPFVDRIYGPNFDTTNTDDLAFIDAVGRLDDAVIDLGLATPTHLVASFRTHMVDCRYPRRRSPQRTLRSTQPAEAPDDAESEGSGAIPQILDTDPEIAHLQSSVEEAWGHYHQLRGRKAVRLALYLANLRKRISRGRSG